MGHRLEDRFDALKLRLQTRSGFMKRVQVLPFRGFGNNEQVYFKGRVLRESGLRPSLDSDRIWHNILATYRRFHSHEMPHAKVRARFGKEVAEVISDAEGYFDLHLKSDPSLAGEWREAEFTLMDSTEEPGDLMTGRGMALFPSETARFGVISDVDDTIVVSHARNLLKLAYTLFLRNARGRVPFEGVAAFYRALREGVSGGERNPIFYVSSGPWNLYDLLMDFFEAKEIPMGPLLMQDYGFDETRFFAGSHLDHKLAQIQTIIEMYPALPFILIGDSGQQDPEIYRRLLEEAPNRIRAVYIRNVTGEGRARQIAKLGVEAREHGGELLLVGDSLEAARHAASHGWISEGALPEIAGETAEDKAAPEPPEELDE